MYLVIVGENPKSNRINKDVVDKNNIHKDDSSLDKYLALRKITKKGAKMLIAWLIMPNISVLLCIMVLSIVRF